MSLRLTSGVIRILCGERAYNVGEACCSAGHVTLLHAEHDAEEPFYEAVVQGEDGDSQVTIDIDIDGGVHAECGSCSIKPGRYLCWHVAAALIAIQEESNDKGAGARGTAAAAPVDQRLTRGFLNLFDEGSTVLPSGAYSRFDAREKLRTTFILRPIPYGYKKHTLGIEMRLGPQRTYIVQRIRDLLEAVQERRPMAFAKHYTYDPERFRFNPEDDAIVRTLLTVVRNERLYRETSGFSHTVTRNRAGGDRLLSIPPYAWESLLPLLQRAADVQFEYGRESHAGLQMTDDPLPLQYTFDDADHAAGCSFAIDGLDDLLIMEGYGFVFAAGRLHRVPDEACRRLTEMKQMLEPSRGNRILIPPEQVEPFIGKVIPGLMKLGSVKIEQAVADRIVQTPLKARLFLDRVRDRLLAGLEFQYGDIVVNPLDAAVRERGEGRILVRDGEKEQRILALMDGSSFAKTEEGYFMEEEEGEYDFLYHTVPQLEELVQVFATTAVKARVVTGMQPQVRADVDERTDWLEFKFELEGVPEDEIRELVRSLAAKRRYHKLPGGALVPLESADFQEIIRIMNETGMHHPALDGGMLRLPAVRSLHLMDAGGPGSAVRLGKSLRRLLDNLRNPDNMDYAVPDGLAGVLRDYQAYGYQWLKALAHYRFGGILADDMGLGKTIQSIAFLVSVLPEIRALRMPALIVCPASLVYNWRNELRRFAPEVRSVIADGTKEERKRLVRRAASGNPDSGSGMGMGMDVDADVVITSYPLLRMDLAVYIDQPFHTLILDEAQMFKNYTTQTAQAVKSLQARHRFALSGTPMENRMEELWSIYDAVFPELFGDRKSFAELTRETVAKRIRPFLLRRLKRDVLRELPDKIETLQASELLPEQKKLYTAYLAELRQETLQHLAQDDLGRNRIRILAGLTRLRQLCCHPALFVDGYTGSSAKFEQLLELVQECRGAGKRMLVFSQFTEMLGLIGRTLGTQGVPFFYLDGSTPPSERVELCNRFNNGERDLFLISLKAGGTGLNLTGADTVILYDLWWNPAVEQQAMDRAHRIGQKNVVQVIRLVAEGTVEDKMYELQQRKINLIEEVIQPGQEALSTLTEADLREILMIE
jgi:superfamily II DNA or RNA helicase